MPDPNKLKIEILALSAGSFFSNSKSSPSFSYHSICHTLVCYNYKLEPKEHYWLSGAWISNHFATITPQLHCKRNSECTSVQKRSYTFMKTYGSASVLSPGQFPRPLPLPVQMHRYLQSTLSVSSQSLLVTWVCLERAASVQNCKQSER